MGLHDVKVMLDLLRAVGADVNIRGRTVTLSKGNLNSQHVPVDCVTTIRSSLLLLGLFLGLGIDISIPDSGGCDIGERKCDLHLMGLERLGADIKEASDGIHASARKLTGDNIEFYLPSTTGTQNVILAALFAEGETIIKNANTRPENMEFAKLLNAMGGKVEARNRIVKVEGAKQIRGGVTFEIMNGWDEAVTYMAAAGVTGGEIMIREMTTEYIKSDVKYLGESGVEIFEWRHNLYVKSNTPLKPFDLFTAPYPGVNSDMQPIFTSLALAAVGESTITDMRFTDRFRYIEELKKFNADINVYGNCAVINGGRKLSGARVRATDLRGGAAEVICGLQAQGETQVANTYQIERGYENFVRNLNRLGARIRYSDNP
jgi:UDP-N-acetylglucosamine 1-carboxyvinyltransferase